VENMVLVKDNNGISWYDDNIDTMLDLVSDNYSYDVSKNIQSHIDDINMDIDYYKEEVEYYNKRLDDIQGKLKYLDDNYDKLNMEDVKEIVTSILIKM
jgi:hypothetical protein